MSRGKKFKPRILVALSGGVDSAVSAALLSNSGYDVTGVFVVNYEGKNVYGEDCWISEYRDAVRVAAHLNIPILKWNFAREYQEYVLEYLFQEYTRGQTPNPDVWCNKFIKFGAWLTRARELGFERLATGHYAKIDQQDFRKLSVKPAKIPYRLLIPHDKVKDQTYFLHQLNQEQLGHCVFPLASYTKLQVRALAKKWKLPVATKEESMGICFVGEISINDFLKQRIKPTPGRIVLLTGEQIGAHEGLAFYTIGQRHFSVHHPGQDNRPLYVLEKRHTTNELVVGYEDDPGFLRREIRLKDTHWISGQAPVFPLQCEVRLRHRQELQSCSLRIVSGAIMVTCAQPQRAVTPGQFAVFYDQGECLGGGIIT